MPPHRGTTHAWIHMDSDDTDDDGEEDEEDYGDDGNRKVDSDTSEQLDMYYGRGEFCENFFTDSHLPRLVRVTPDRHTMPRPGLYWGTPHV